MKNKGFKLVLFIMLATFLSACGRDGLDGKDGLDGTITKSIYFDIAAADWKWNQAEQAYTVTFNNVSELDQISFEEGSISVYMLDDEKYDHPLPWTIYHFDEVADYQWSETYSYKVKTRTIMFYQKVSNDYDVDRYNAEIKVVITRSI